MKKLIKYILILALPISFVISLNPIKVKPKAGNVFTGHSRLTKADSG